MCVRVACFWACDVRRTFAHFLEQNYQKAATFCLKNYSRTSFLALERLFLFQNIFFYFRTLRMLKNCRTKIQKVVEKMLLCGCEVRPLQIGGAHTCVCAPKAGRARCVRATQKTVATHTLFFFKNVCPVHYTV